MSEPTVHKGSCLCGAVKIEVVGPLPPPDACHCSQCRKQSGHFGVSTDVPRTSLTVHGADHVKWFESSTKARRGFCDTCGSCLFFDPLDQAKHAWIAVAMGVFDGPTATKINVHIHVADKGDYYDITDGLPQRPAGLLVSS